jgi:hypothetical protein
LNPRIEVLQTSPLGLLGTAPSVCQYSGTTRLLSVYSLQLEKWFFLVHNRVRFMSPLHGYRARIDADAPAAASDDTDDRIWAYGPCLHLGPRGQRCDHAALEGGFCVRHAVDAIDIGPWTWFRRLAAVLVAVAILWPIVEAFLEELSHWRH